MREGMRLIGLIGVVLAVATNMAWAQKAIGEPSPENQWDTRSGVISVRSSTHHSDNIAEHLVDGSGIDEAGNQTRNEGHFISSNLVDSKSIPRGGTVEGGHWVEFEFDHPYRLGEMWIWNYNARTEEYDWRKLGFKRVTIQCSVTGGTEPGEWKTVFEGEIPMADSPAPDFLSPVSLSVDFSGAEAKYVVITTADSPDHNWCSSADPSGDILDHGGLSEVRFFPMPEDKATSR